jgi:uncharacterized protein YcfL
MNLRKSLLILPLALLPAVGCKSVNTVEQDKPTFHANVVQDSRIETDGFLSKKAKILQVRKGIAQDNLMRIDVEILNDNPWEGNFDYKFEWFDGDGLPVDSPTSTWTSRHIEAKETISIDAIAPNPQCKDFRLKLQRSKRD